MDKKIIALLKQPAGVLFLFIFLAVALRFFSFFPTILDHDESTYLEIAREMLEGKKLYVDLIDIKPPGIFLIYAFFQLVFGHPIWVMRLLSAVCIALTAFMVFKTSRLIVPGNRVGLAGGFIYILFVSTWASYGISPNTEIYFNLFTISALYVFLKRDHWLNFLGAGLIMGMGFIIKYVVLFDFAAILLFFLLRALRKPSWPRLRTVIVNCFLSFTGFLMPFLAVNLYYYLTGNFTEFAEYAYFAVARYPKEFVPVRMMKFVLDFYVLFLPVHLIFFYSLFIKTGRGSAFSDLRLLSVIWIPLALAGILLPGNRFTHYFIQLMLPVSLQAGTFFRPDVKLPALLHKITSGTIGFVLLVSLLSILFVFSYRDYYERYDAPEQIADYLRPRLQPDDVIYTGNRYHVLYYLLEKDSPTPFVHSSLLNSAGHREALGIDLDKELQRLSSIKPLYILIQTQGSYSIEWIYPFLNENYMVEQSFGKKTLLYRRKDKAS